MTDNNTNVMVNGKSVQLDANGAYSQSNQTEHGTSNIDVNVSNDQTGNSTSNRSSVSIEVHSSSSSQTN